MTRYVVLEGEIAVRFYAYETIQAQKETLTCPMKALAVYKARPERPVDVLLQVL